MDLPTFPTAVSDHLYHPILSWERSGIGILTGKSGIYRLALQWEYAFAVSGFKIFNLDCAIRFNPFVITAETRKRNVPPESLLENILVQRAFTPYQILDSLRAISAQNPKNTIYFLLAPCKQFFDGDVQEDEGRFLLQRMLSILQELQSERFPILVVESLHYPHPTFENFFPQLIQTASDLWELRTEDKLSYLKTRKRSVSDNVSVSQERKGVTQ
ncbi:hypothetical protein EHQ12_01635 [Leptospira gomenensis]|uniref:Uncharacterized protein n=1 Tax=Leptospira gomenensis TaxID=2484974 RepID=A0A5F1YU53_9LEPT|nr:hypothetical protein [Leptospira gomenensis]TGK31769.1 hypothetical protein EHQ17_13390 [Leptospira gomenensis]TGK41603.1 hypothetical protein EHQ07_16085 [Leptospira gomenensis]TGK44416.1 hypothetical protein EHQ12_01635 [Leptospira gomenensis]TGK61437.1 hypothetical protein EHQ13_08780 [Leptospira gomenensis]